MSSRDQTPTNMIDPKLSTAVISTVSTGVKPDIIFATSATINHNNNNDNNNNIDNNYNNNNDNNNLQQLEG